MLIRIASVAALLCVLVVPGLAGALRFEDEQVRVVDHALYENENVQLLNRSAFTIQDGGVLGSLTAHHDCWVQMTGGRIRWDVFVYAFCEIDISGGAIGYSLSTYGSSTTSLSGGQIGRTIYAREQSVVKVFGSEFRVDDVAVDHGPLVAQSGYLTGTLSSGEQLGVSFRQGEEASSSYTGTILLVDGVPSPSPPPDYSHTVVLLDDGEEHSIDDDSRGGPTGGVRVRSPLASTTLRILPGAVLPHTLHLSGPSLVEMRGGNVAHEAPPGSSSFIASDGVFDMSGGTFGGWGSMREGTVYLSGGVFAGSLGIEYGGLLSISGGEVGEDLTCHSFDHYRYDGTERPARIDMTGGTVGNDLRVWNDCVATLSGGRVVGRIEAGFGALEIIGRRFAVDGVRVAYGELESWSGRLTGRLESGDLLDNEFARSEGIHESTIVLTAPEPSAGLLHGLAFVLVMAIRRARRFA